MNKPFVRVLSLLAVGVALATLGPRPAVASDHADPIISKAPESNITGLFFFPKDDQYILILAVRPRLTSPGPYDLEPFEYAIHMDLHSAVTFTSDEDRARYGGTVVNPDGISADVTIKFHLNGDTSVKEQSFVGFRDPTGIRVWTGVRDDPFIFPRFFKKNVIAMVMSIPMTAFPDGQQDWILWATTAKDGDQIDHVGRSNRTQLARFDFLNTVPPSRQVGAIMKQLEKTRRAYDFANKFKLTMPLAGLIQYVFEIRKYDLVPDVMIYTNRFPPGFPNGRQLPDDVAAITCAVGDCVLQEVSFIEGGWPRATVNDKAFLDEFPYLAEPWPATAEAAPAGAMSCWWPFLIVIALLVLIWLLIRRWRRRRRR